LSTCRKQGIKASQALDNLFRGKLPDFPHTKTGNLVRDAE